MKSLAGLAERTRDLNLNDHGLVGPSVPEFLFKPNQLFLQLTGLVANLFQGLAVRKQTIHHTLAFLREFFLGNDVAG